MDFFRWLQVCVCGLSFLWGLAFPKQPLGRGLAASVPPDYLPWAKFTRFIVSRDRVTTCCSLWSLALSSP